MIETELREAFARAEALVPDGTRLVPAIARAARGRVRRRRWAQAGAAMVLVLLVVAVPTAGRAWLDRPTEADLLPGDPVARDLSGALNILVAGLDGSAEGGAEAPSRADMIMVVHVPADRSALYLLTIPRDLEVDLPDRPWKINASYVHGGYPLLAQTVSDVVGVRIDVGAALLLDGLAPVVDALGGVHLCVDVLTTSIHTGRTYPVGCYEMDSASAVDYVRQRGYPDGSFGRDRHAAQLTAALIAKARPALTDVGQLQRLAKAAAPALTVDLGGYNLEDIAFAVGGATDQVIALTVPTRVLPHAGNLELDAGAAELFEALRADTLGAWAAANPSAIVPGTG
jgi:LCP family protein required for cell wall assembly